MPTSSATQSRYDTTLNELVASPKSWLITGVAGFIGSNLLETLLRHDQVVVGLDNFSTGRKANLSEVHSLVTDEQWGRFIFIEGDICDVNTCKTALLSANGQAVNYVLHQAALGSVPRSIADPIATNHSNISGFLNMLTASRDAAVDSFTYAASSSTYGDHPDLPKVEHKIGKPLSPYAITKYVNELYAEIFAQCYSFKSIGLRYFNVFGPRQDPNGAYAAVIPKWIDAFQRCQPITINGDGETSRDFCFVDNAVQANVLAAVADEQSKDNVYNIAVGESTTLNQLCNALRKHFNLSTTRPVYGTFRSGDVRHSCAAIDKAVNLLGYQPTHRFQDGLALLLNGQST